MNKQLLKNEFKLALYLYIKMLVKTPVIRFYEWTKAYVSGIFILSKDWQ